MNWFKTMDLMAIVDFVYHGDTYIYKEDLNGFLFLTEDLHLKCLSGYEDKVHDSAENSSMKQKCKTPTKVKQESGYKTNSSLSMESQNIPPVNNGKLVVATNISTEDHKGN